MMIREPMRVIVGYLVTLENGYACRLGPDLGRAQHYAAEQRAVSVEPMYVLRDAPPTRQDGAGGPIDGSVAPRVAA